MGAKILVADDSITIQKVIGLSFANEDFILESADNGDEALEKALANPPDLIIADTNMPGLSGYELCERVRSNNRLAAIPVILLTGTYEVFDEERAHKVGSNDHLTKPFESQVLIKKVKQLLANPPAAPTKPLPVAPPASSPTAPSKSAQPSPAFEEFETIENIEEIQADTINIAESADFASLVDDRGNLGPAKPRAATAASAPTANTTVSENDPFGFGDAAPAEPTTPPTATKPSTSKSEDINFAELAAATSSKSEDYVSDWNMDEFENYLAQETEQQATAPTPASTRPSTTATPTTVSLEQAAPSDKTFEEVETLDIQAEAAPIPTTKAQSTVDVFAEFEQTYEAEYEAEPEPDAVATHVKNQPQTQEGIELETDLASAEMELEISTDLASEVAAISPRTPSQTSSKDSLETAAAAQFEQTFDSDVSTIETPPPAPLASFSSAELTEQIQTQVGQQLQQVLAGSAVQKQIASAVDAAISSALGPAVEKAVTTAVDQAVTAAVDKAVKRVLDELRRRLS